MAESREVLRPGTSPRPAPRRSHVSPNSASRRLGGELASSPRLRVEKASPV